ncbi:hypothetical protein AD998_01405 [bacterium 336/3]|nr:hypothetical protein AD998_01405 [bacterium 336/3]
MILRPYCFLLFFFFIQSNVSFSQKIQLEVLGHQKSAFFKDYSEKDTKKIISDSLINRIYLIAANQGRKGDIIIDSLVAQPDYHWQVVIFDTVLYNQNHMGFKYRIFESSSPKIPPYEYGSISFMLSYNKERQKSIFNMIYTIIASSSISRIPLKNPQQKNTLDTDSLDTFNEIIIRIHNKTNNVRYFTHLKKLFLSTLSSIQSNFSLRKQQYINFYILEEKDKLPPISSKKPIILHYSLEQNKDSLLLRISANSPEIETKGQIFFQDFDLLKESKQTFSIEELLFYPSDIYSKFQVSIMGLLYINGLKP